MGLDANTTPRTPTLLIGSSTRKQGAGLAATVGSTARACPCLGASEPPPLRWPAGRGQFGWAFWQRQVRHCRPATSSCDFPTRLTAGLVFWLNHASTLPRHTLAKSQLYLNPGSTLPQPWLDCGPTMIQPWFNPTWLNPGLILAHPCLNLGLTVARPCLVTCSTLVQSCFNTALSLPRC